MTQPTFNWLRELLWVTGSAVIGLAVVPLLIFTVGHRLFGEYGKAHEGFAAFFANLLADLATLQPAAWIIVLGPVVLVMGLRWLLLTPGNNAGKTVVRQRREPTA